MGNVIRKAFQRVFTPHEPHEQPILCKFCGQRVKDAHYAADGTIVSGPKSKTAYRSDTGVTVIWHKSCHRPDRARECEIGVKADSASGMAMEAGTGLVGSGYPLTVGFTIGDGGSFSLAGKIRCLPTRYEMMNSMM